MTVFAEVIGRIVSADMTPEKLGAIAVLACVCAYSARVRPPFWMVCGTIIVLVLITGGLGLLGRMHGL